MGENCATCRFAEAVQDHTGSPVGYVCRFNPPAYRGDRDATIRDRQRGSIESSYPTFGQVPVDADDWCGKWKLNQGGDHERGNR